MKLHSYDRQMVEMFVTWSPYGGPPEDEIWIEFGISSDRLLERVTAIVSKCFKEFLHNEDRYLLLRAREALRHPADEANPTPSCLLAVSKLNACVEHFAAGTGRNRLPRRGSP